MMLIAILATVRLPSGSDYHRCRHVIWFGSDGNSGCSWYGGTVMLDVPACRLVLRELSYRCLARP
jgi:hypothetical protein